MLARLRAARAGGGYERWEHRTNGLLLVLAVVFLIVLLLPFFVHLTGGERRAVDTVSLAVWVVFTVDYVVRLYLAPERLRFVRTHLLDLVVVLLPTLRPLRALRVLDLLRLGSAVGVAERRAQRSFHARVTSYAVVTAVAVVGLGAAAMVDAERGARGANIKTFSEALWWAVTTVTTVGYGDHYPTTGTGRLIAIGLMVVGIMLLGVVTATIAAWFVDRLKGVEETERRTEELLTTLVDELREVRARLDDLDAARRPAADP